MSRKVKITVILPFVKQYRAPFLELLRSEADKLGYEIKVYYGHATGVYATQSENVAPLKPETGTLVKGYWFLKALYLPVTLKIFSADAVIIQQEAKFVQLYLLILLSKLRLKRFALWGLGYPAFSTQSPFSLWLKKFSLLAPSHWFAYTDLSKKYLMEQKYPESHITVVQNSTDTRFFKEELSRVSQQERDHVLEKLRIGKEDFNILYCGSLYFDKKIDGMIEIIERIRKRIPVNFIVLGDGPEKEKIENAAKTREWLKYLGPLFGAEKAKVFSVSKFFLCPGLVGLAIVDAFAAGLPLLTEKDSPHSPEIVYLKSRENGYMAATRDELVDFAIRIAEDSNLRKKLSDGAIETSKILNIESMVERFLAGLQKFVPKK